MTAPLGIADQATEVIRSDPEMADREAGWPTGSHAPDTRQDGTPGLTCGSDTSDSSDTDAQAARDRVLLAELRDGEWLGKQTFPPLRYAVPGLIPEGLTLLIGPPKAGKSWLTLGVLLAVGAGGRALGKLPTGPARRVLYLALEDGDRRMQDRCRQLLGQGAPIPDMFHYLTAIEPGQVLAVIGAFLRRYPDTALVVVDTLGKVMPPAQMGESAYQRDYRVGGALKREADRHVGLAVVVLHHDRKAAAEDFVDAVSGTHGLAGAADTIAVLHRRRQSTDGLLKITGRDVVEAEYALTVADGKWSLDGDDLDAAAECAQQREDAAGLSDTSADILKFVRAAGAGGVRAADVTAKFGKDAYQYLKRQVDAGRLVKPARGLYADPDCVRTVRTSDSQVSGHTGSDTCSVCQKPLDPANAGFDTHPNCDMGTAA